MYYHADKQFLYNSCKRIYSPATLAKISPFLTLNFSKRVPYFASYKSDVFNLNCITLD